VIGWGVVLIFLLAAALMVTRVLPALLALPLLATGIGVLLVGAGQLAWQDLFLGIWADGAVRLAEPMVIALLGGMLSNWLQKTGVAPNLVRVGAELAGDRPWLLSVLVLGAGGAPVCGGGGVGGGGHGGDSGAAVRSQIQINVIILK